MVSIVNASTSSGLVNTADTSGIIKVQSNGVTTNALAWVNFVGSTASINSSYNISSVTRNAAGQYTVSFTNAMSSSNYVIAGFCFGNSGTGRPFINQNTGWNSYSTSSFQIQSGDSGSNYDVPATSIVVFGN